MRRVLVSLINGLVMFSALTLARLLFGGDWSIDSDVAYFGMLGFYYAMGYWLGNGGFQRP